MLAIIPAYKNPQQLKRCLASLEGQPGIRPWVHDNTDDNIGFTAAVNRGLRESFAREDEFALILNQDCYLLPNAVQEFVKLMTLRPKCAIAGAKQLLERDPDIIVHGGCTVAYPAGVHLSGRASDGDCAVSFVQPWVNGACMFVRMEAVREFGLMDEGMFLIGSDSDWCYTARARGWEVWYCAEAQCLHECGISANPTPEVKQVMSRDMTYWREKWVGSVQHAKLAQMSMNVGAK